jgi:hypothetical protein
VPMDRRLFFKQASYYSSALLFACKSVGRSVPEADSFLSVSPVNSTIPKRVSWDALTPAKQKAFKDAVLSMKATQIDVPATFGTGGARKLDLWSAQAEVHQWYCSHRNGNFLPWHRAYLYHFELFLRQKIDDDFRLPYWDWSKDQTLPKGLDDADFVKALGVTRGSKTIAVAGTTGEQLTAAWWAAAAKTISKSSDYDTIGGDRGVNSSSGLIESPYHNMVHVGVGGDMGQVPLAAKDPVFWLHHCNVDRLWSLWMDKIMASGKIRRLFPAVDVDGWLLERYLNHFWTPGSSKDKPPLLTSARNRNILFTQHQDYVYDTMTKTWELKDIPNDQAVVEKTANVTQVKQKAAGLQLADTGDTQLTINFAWPAIVLNSPQSLVSLRLKLGGLPEPKDSTMSYEVSLSMGDKVFPLGDIGFFPGGHDKHAKGLIGLNMNDSMETIRTMLASQPEASLNLVLKDTAGKVVSIPGATTGFQTEAPNYTIVIKSVFE